jgi:predicted NACHT family NTPase
MTWACTAARCQADGMDPVFKDLETKLGPFPTWLYVVILLLVAWPKIKPTVSDLSHGFRAVFCRRSKLSDEDHHRLEQRQMYAETVESQIRDLDLKERWTHHQFAQLEAEVETERDGAARRLRREPSLADALERSRSKLVQLTGDPGSGKSVALRFVARQMAEKARDAKRLDSVIPLYLNLKLLNPDDFWLSEGDRR